MPIEDWYSLRSLVRRHLRGPLGNSFTETKAKGAGWLAGSGYVVLRRGDIWVLVSRHMGEDHIELAFQGPPQVNDWYDVVNVLMACGVQFNIVPGEPAIAHRLKDKAAALVAHFDEIERALAENRTGFLAKLTEIREDGIRRGVEAINGPTAHVPQNRKSRDLPPSPSSLGR